jgi:hypothetical protein
VIVIAFGRAGVVVAGDEQRHIYIRSAETKSVL